jgi:tripartite-type tricarboxylate transporter receptor subunit TctC
MNNKTGRWLAAAASMLVCSLANAQAYPSKPIRWIVPYPAGGGVDVISRAIATPLSAGFGQPIIIDNRGGASGNIATEAGARAAPDGYTVLSTDNGIMTMNPHGFRSLPYHPLKDFQPVSLYSLNNFILTVSTKVPATDIGQFIAHARANPGKVTYASSGSGTVMHIWSELLARSAGLTMVHVPYKGTGPALQDLVGGQVDMFLNTYSTAAPLIAGGKIRALAVTMKEQHPKLPGVPTLAASGVKDYDVYGWIGLLSPAGTPRPVVNRFNAELARVIPELRPKYADLGTILTTSTPEEFSDLIRKDLERWGPIMKDLKVQFD